MQETTGIVLSYVLQWSGRQFILHYVKLTGHFLSTTLSKIGHNAVVKCLDLGTKDHI